MDEVFASICDTLVNGCEANRAHPALIDADADLLGRADTLVELVKASGGELDALKVTTDGSVRGATLLTALVPWSQPGSGLAHEADEGSRWWAMTIQDGEYKKVELAGTISDLQEQACAYHARWRLVPG